MTSFGMEEDKMFYHCCGCGGIYAEKEKRTLIAKVDKGTLPRVLQSFNISTGLCGCCLDEYNHKKKEQKRRDSRKKLDDYVEGCSGVHNPRK